MADATSDRIQSIEERIEKLSEKTNDKLDVLIDLTKQLAILQAQQNHQHEELARVSTAQSLFEVEYRSGVVRLHERIDAMKAETTARRAEVDKTIQVELKEKRDVDDKLQAEIVKVDSTFNKSLFYVKGVLAALSIIAILIPPVATKFYTDITHSIEKTATAIDNMNLKMTENEKQVERLLQQVREIKGTHDQLIDKGSEVPRKKL